MSKTGPPTFYNNTFYNNNILLWIKADSSDWVKDRSIIPGQVN